MRARHNDRQRRRLRAPRAAIGEAREYHRVPNVAMCGRPSDLIAVREIVPAELLKQGLAWVEAILARPRLSPARAERLWRSFSETCGRPLGVSIHTCASNASSAENSLARLNIND